MRKRRDERIVFLLALKKSNTCPFSKLPKVLKRYICESFLTSDLIWREKGILGTIESSEDGLTAEKKTKNQSHDVIVIKRGFNKGIIEWEVTPFWAEGTPQGYRQVYIGVTDDLSVPGENKEEIAFGQGIYWWVGGLGYFHGQDNESKDIGSQSGEAVKVKLNFEIENPIVSFFLGEQFKWEHPLEKNKEYYPSVSIWKTEQSATLGEFKIEYPSKN